MGACAQRATSTSYVLLLLLPFALSAFGLLFFFSVGVFSAGAGWLSVCLLSLILLLLLLLLLYGPRWGWGCVRPAVGHVHLLPLLLLSFALYSSGCCALFIFFVVVPSVVASAGWDIVDWIELENPAVDYRSSVRRHLEEGSLRPSSRDSPLPTLPFNLRIATSFAIKLRVGFPGPLESVFSVCANSEQGHFVSALSTAVAAGPRYSTASSAIVERRQQEYVYFPLAITGRKEAANLEPTAPHRGLCPGRYLSAHSRLQAASKKLLPPS